MRVTICAVALALGLISVISPIRAANHLWHIHEVYSNPASTLQYVEMYDDSNNEQFVGGQTLTAKISGQSRTFSFPSNLGTNLTANHHLLIASPGFAAATGVTPDYTFTSSPFVFLSNGSMQFSGSFSTVSWTGNPFTGNVSIGETGQPTAPTPTNFAGQTGNVPEPGGVVVLVACGVALRRPRRG